MSIHIQLERFEGPLALLLHLIRREEMDIFDINIHQITRQYMEYIKSLKQLDLEVAGEFIAMAATLIHIKSRMLLPSYNDEGEEDESADPRKELVQRLLDYQKYKEASEQLYSRSLLHRDQLPRGERTHFSVKVEDDIQTEDNPLFSLISAYRTVVRNVRQGIHRVGEELQSIASRILELRTRLPLRQRVLMSDLLDRHSERSAGAQVLVTFLSLLELAKMGFVSLFQSDNFGPLHVEAQKEIDRDVVTRVEEFDTGAAQAEKVAEQLMLEGQLQEVDFIEDPRDLGEIKMATDADILEAEKDLQAFPHQVDNDPTETSELDAPEPSDYELISHEAMSPPEEKI